jgi:anti-anti-sigma factor
VPSREPSPSDILSLDVRPERGRVVVAVRGELDMATIGSVEDALQELREAGSRDVVLDLRALTFVDCAGLNMLLAADRDARADGWKWRSSTVFQRSSDCWRSQAFATTSPPPNNRRRQTPRGSPLRLVRTTTQGLH